MQEVCPPFQLMIFERHANLKPKYGSRSFWCRGYYFGRRIPTPVCALARNDRERADRVVRPYKGLSKIPARDVEDAVPYGMAENGADRVVRPYKRAVKGRR